MNTAEWELYRMKISEQTQKYETYDEQFVDLYNIGICIWYTLT